MRAQLTPMPAAPALIAICRSCVVSPTITVRAEVLAEFARQFVQHGRMRLQGRFRRRSACRRTGS